MSLLLGFFRLTKTVSALAQASWSGQETQPTTDVSDGSWLNEAGSATNLFASIDETQANDADYIHSNTTTTTCEVGLGALTLPGTGTVSIFVRGKVV